MKEVEEEREKEERERGGTGARDSFRYPRQAEREPRRGSIKKQEDETCAMLPNGYARDV